MEEIWPKYQKEHKKAQTSQGIPPADKGGPTRPYGPISSRIGAPHQRPAGPMALLPSSTRVEARFSPTKAPSRARPFHTSARSGALPSPSLARHSGSARSSFGLSPLATCLAVSLTGQPSKHRPTNSRHVFVCVSARDMWQARSQILSACKSSSTSEFVQLIVKISPKII